MIVTAEADADGTPYIAGTATTPASALSDGKPIGEAAPRGGGWWRRPPTAAVIHTVRADQVQSDGTVIARRRCRSTGVEAVIQLLAPLPPGVRCCRLRARIETVIIKKGDNCGIARGGGRSAGHHLMRPTATRSQPALDLLGQVFVMPKGDTAWELGAGAVPAGFS